MKIFIGENVQTFTDGTRRRGNWMQKAEEHEKSKAGEGDR